MAVVLVDVPPTHLHTARFPAVAYLRVGAGVAWSKAGSVELSYADLIILCIRALDHVSVVVDVPRVEAMGELWVRGYGGGEGR